MIKDFGGRVASVWETLRPVTKEMIVGAMQSSLTSQPIYQSPRLTYDAHADWELSSLLSAIDEQAKTSEILADESKLTEISHLADTCVRVLENQTASAEVFIQLASRALRENDYNRLDKLADRLAERFTSGEIAEIVRQTHVPQIRAIAYETLAMMPVQALVPLLDDGIYSDIAIAALEQKAFEFDSDEAKDALEQFDSENGGPAI